ncbi:ATP-binding protein [Nitrosospira sp. Nsp1]|uniref:AAA family ATPase n=1 Tax=Nitrosospira sp. Nsp1 TaxID=136547 RepID=UPI00088C5006|nr:ATP-binding protein [Nitrosospira sp. Nsp1]SCX61568.1 ATPase family associated with various cellular activities (AAA) [Nitrosospira sp. Nsp1]
MADPLTQEHDLEDHIQLLRKLDAVRKRSAELRDEGIEVLMDCLQPFGEKKMLPAFGDWRHENSLVVRALLTRHDQPFSKEKEKTRLELIKSLTKQLQQDLTLEKLAEHELSVLVAASVLRTLVAQPGAAFSKTAMLCYYWIIRELYSADRSDWNIGGARAAPGGLVTAFVTGECIRALLSFADALRNTGNFIAEAGNYIARTTQLDSLNDHYFLGRTPEPLKEWAEAEKKRLSLSCLLKFRRLSHYLVLALPPDQSTEVSSVEKCLQVKDITKSTEFKQKLEKLLKETEETFESTLQDIIAYRKKECEGETSPTSQDPLEICKNTLSTCEERLYGSTESEPSASSRKTKADVTRSASAHLIAFQAVQDAKKRTKKKVSLVTQCDETDVKTFENLCKDIKREFDESAHQVENLLHPVRNYLSSVLDRELALVSLGECWDSQPCELACAAASYGKLTKEWGKDTRFDRAVSDLSKMISSRGRFANLRHYHEQPGGPRHLMNNAATLHAMAQLLHHACDSEFKTDMADNMLRFFEDTRAGQISNFWPISATDITHELIQKLDDTSIQQVKDIRKKLSAEMTKLLDLANSHLKIKDRDDLPKAFSELLARRLAKEVDGLVQADPSIESLLGVKRASSGKKGWDWEYSQPPLRANLKATARAVMALAKINEMLDRRINHIILEHFSVKRKNKELSEDLTLDALFYPDYGLRLAPDANTLKTIAPRPNWIKEKDWPKNGLKRQNSVAITLQRMRAHVSGVSLPEGDPLYSLVLHGPAGTGKTTLVEALAVSCDVPLVEVTPSDLVKYGEADIEQRARAVFEALSMLTRVVILFDEFDPVLKRREVDSNKPLDVFSFLTPGMLPKLKDLNNGAKKRAVAYVLVTNLIGKLDEAAVRQGRFDERLGIYPPDLLSRTGRLLDQIREDPPKPPLDRIIEIIKKTEGKGMTTLGKPGWFTIPDKKRKELKTKPGTPFRFLHLKDSSKSIEELKTEARLEWPEPDDELKGICGEGPTAVKECLQWKWINKWDEQFSEKLTFDALCKALNKHEINFPPPKFAQSSRDQWEVMISPDRPHSHMRRMLIRHPRHDTDES